MNQVFRKGTLRRGSVGSLNDVSAKGLCVQVQV